MQVVHATFEAGEGEEAVKVLKNLGVDIEDYKLIQSDTGDLLIINLLYGKVDLLLDRLKERFDFSKNVNRSLIIFSPDAVIPRDKEKTERYNFRAARETIITYAKDNVKLNSQFIFLAIVAAVIASLGLILDNTPVIVGSMIIAPVFGPIAAIAVGIVLGDFKLLIKGVIAELMVILIGVAVGLISGVVIPNVTLNHALQVRMVPTIPDLLVALAAGGAGAYSLVTHVKSQQLIGVVIAAALIPVMATIGIGISLNYLPMVSGGILLLLGNFFTLLLAIIIVFYLKGLKPQFWYKFTAKRLVKRSLIIIVLSVIILAIPLSFITYQQMVKEKPEDIVRSIYREKFGDQLEERLFMIDIEDKVVKLIIYTPLDTNKYYFKLLEEEIKDKLGDNYQVIFNIIPIKKVLD